MDLPFGACRTSCWVELGFLLDKSSVEHQEMRSAHDIVIAKMFSPHLLAEPGVGSPQNGLPLLLCAI